MQLYSREGNSQIIDGKGKQGLILVAAMFACGIGCPKADRWDLGWMGKLAGRDYFLHPWALIRSAALPSSTSQLRKIKIQ